MKLTFNEHIVFFFSEGPLWLNRCSMFIQKTVFLSWLSMWIWIRALSSVLHGSLPGRFEKYCKHSFHVCFSCQKIPKTIAIVWKQVDESELKLPVYEYFQLDQIVFTRIYKSTIPEIRKFLCSNTEQQYTEFANLQIISTGIRPRIVFTTSHKSTCYCSGPQYVFKVVLTFKMHKH